MTDRIGRQRDSVELKVAAKESLDGKWLVAIAVCLVAWLLVDAFTSNNGANASYRYIWQNGDFVRVHGEGNPFKGLMSIVSLIIGGPIYYGVAGYFLKLARRQPAEFTDMFSGFSLFKTNFIMHILITIFTILWTLLLIIPGIIAAIKYSMAFYILNDGREQDEVLRNVAGLPGLVHSWNSDLWTGYVVCNTILQGSKGQLLPGSEGKLCSIIKCLKSDRLKSLSLFFILLVLFQCALRSRNRYGISIREPCSFISPFVYSTCTACGIYIVFVLGMFQNDYSFQ